MAAAIDLSRDVDSAKGDASAIGSCAGSKVTLANGPALKYAAQDGACPRSKRTSGPKPGTSYADASHGPYLINLARGRFDGSVGVFPSLTVVVCDRGWLFAVADARR
jgi:hypothetical protein